MIFIDGTWLYVNTPRLAQSYHSSEYQIDFSKLPRVLAEELRERLPFPVEIDLARTYLFGSYADNHDPRDADSVRRRLDFFQMLREEYGYEAETYPVNYRGRRLRRIDRAPGDTFEPKEKCVDIAMATTMSHFAAVPGSYDIAIAVLGDADFMPMLQHVRRLGKRVAIASIKGTCSEEYLEQGDGDRSRDFDIIWLDDILEKLELRFERQRRECEAAQHVGDPLVWTTYRPRRGEKFYCDSCRAERARERAARGALSIPAPNSAASSATVLPEMASTPVGSDETRPAQRRGRVYSKKPDGYGFIRSEDGSQYFFHAKELRAGLEFASLIEGTEVLFEVEAPAADGKAPRAINVTGLPRGEDTGGAGPSLPAAPAGFMPAYSRDRQR